MDTNPASRSVHRVPSPRLRQNAIQIAVAVAVTIAALCVFAVNGARADDAAPTGIPDPSIATSLSRALADPGGIRRNLAARGITVGVNYIGEVLGVASGGRERDAHFFGRLELWLDADLERLAGWKGLSLHATAHQLHGTSITAESLGTLMPVSSIEGTPATRLFEVWLEQNLFDGAVSIRAGQLAVDAEFMLSEGAAAFVSATWGWPPISADNLPNGGPAYPLSAPGVRVALNANGNFGVMAAAFNGDVVDDCPPGADPQRCNDHGLDFPFGNGMLFFAESFVKFSGGGGALPGRMRFGGWFHDGHFSDLVEPALSQHGDHGLYAVWDQTIAILPGEGRRVAIFARVMGSPSDRNQIDFYAEGGLTVTGLFANRPGDLLGIGYAYTGLSDGAKAVDRAAGQSVVRDYEALVEISYTAEIVPGWTVQPDFQYFWNPGGHVPDESGAKAVEDAVVLGVRSSLSY